MVKQQFGQEAHNNLMQNLIFTQQMQLATHHIYGNTRLGIKNTDTTLYMRNITINGFDTLGNVLVNDVLDSLQLQIDTVHYQHALATKQYELTNHLGNVLATVLDRKTQNQADVVSAQHYYPFGSAMQTWEAGGKEYAFSYNGKPDDNEVAGMQDYGMRIYDRRLARFKSVDPIAKEYPDLSTYQFASNTPIQAIDLDGLEAFYIHGTWATPNTYPALTITTVNKIFHNTQGSEFSWSGNNTDAFRRLAANKLVQHILAHRDGKQPITLVGHSHGGNVAIMATNILKKDYGIIVDNLLTINTPVREYQLDKGLSTRHFNIYHDYDPVQGGAGDDIVLPDKVVKRVPLFLGGSAKYRSGEMGILTKRTFDGAINFKVPGFQNNNPTNFHDSHQRPELWGVALYKAANPVKKLAFKLDVGRYLQNEKKDNTRLGN